MEVAKALGQQEKLHELDKQFTAKYISLMGTVQQIEFHEAKVTSLNLAGTPTHLIIFALALVGVWYYTKNQENNSFFKFEWKNQNEDDSDNESDDSSDSRNASVEHSRDNYH